MKTSIRSKGNYLMFERIRLIEDILREGYYPNAISIQKKVRDELGVEYSIPTIWRDVRFIKDRLNCSIKYDPHQKGYYLK